MQIVPSPFSISSNINEGLRYNFILESSIYIIIHYSSAKHFQVTTGRKHYSIFYHKVQQQPLTMTGTDFYWRNFEELKNRLKYLLNSLQIRMYFKISIRN